MLGFVRHLLLATVLLSSASAASAELSVPDGLSADQAFERLALTGAVAAAYANACKSQGVDILPQYATPDVSRDADFLVSLGYARDDVVAAHGKLSSSDLFASALGHMLNRGVNLSDQNSICNAARQEIVDGTAVGKRLFLSR